MTLFENPEKLNSNILINNIKSDENNFLVDILIQGFYNNEELIENFIEHLFYEKNILYDEILKTIFFSKEIKNFEFEKFLPFKSIPHNFNNKKNTFLNKKEKYFQINLTFLENINNFKFINDINNLLLTFSKLIKNPETKILFCENIFNLNNNNLYIYILEKDSIIKFDSFSEFYEFSKNDELICKYIEKQKNFILNLN